MSPSENDNPFAAPVSTQLPGECPRPELQRVGRGLHMISLSFILAMLTIFFLFGTFIYISMTAVPGPAGVPSLLPTVMFRVTIASVFVGWVVLITGLERCISVPSQSRAKAAALLSFVIQLGHLGWISYVLLFERFNLTMFQIAAMPQNVYFQFAGGFVFLLFLRDLHIYLDRRPLIRRATVLLFCGSFWMIIWVLFNNSLLGVTSVANGLTTWLLILSFGFLSLFGAGLLNATIEAIRSPTPAGDVP